MPKQLKSSKIVKDIGMVSTVIQFGSIPYVNYTERQMVSNMKNELLRARKWE